jgi:hypothetical protein
VGLDVDEEKAVLVFELMERAPRPPAERSPGGAEMLGEDALGNPGRGGRGENEPRDPDRDRRGTHAFLSVALRGAARIPEPSRPITAEPVAAHRPAAPRSHRMSARNPIRRAPRRAHHVAGPAPAPSRRPGLDPRADLSPMSAPDSIPAAALRSHRVSARDAIRPAALRSRRMSAWDSIRTAALRSHRMSTRDSIRPAALRSRRMSAWDSIRPAARAAPGRCLSSTA